MQNINNNQIKGTKEYKERVIKEGFALYALKTAVEHNINYDEIYSILVDLKPCKGGSDNV